VQRDTFSVGNATFGDGRLTIIAGPCVIESFDHALMMARECAARARDAGLDFVYKSSFDKANRSSVKSFRGHGMEAGLDVLRRVKEEVCVPVVTDVHDVSQVERVAEVADILQIPAFLSRQTDLITAAVRTGRGPCGQRQEGAVSRAAGRAQHCREGARRRLSKVSADRARGQFRL
jgi:2-dehydro-3-deoxyphosphooctonate aldolase (KDO 8-P synthase)